MFVMFAINCRSTGDNGGKPGTVCRHGVPHSGVKKEFSGIKGVGGHNIQNTLLHLIVLLGAEARGSLVAIDRISGPGEFRDDYLETGVVTCFPTEKSKEVCNGLMDPIDATTLFAHKEVVRTPSEISVANGNHT
jgi:hypothetical protein